MFNFIIILFIIYYLIKLIIKNKINFKLFLKQIKCLIMSY